ncbi:MAG TPA: right-handed parallel beta-helix repeat-containing protein [Methylomirabilota bacterium]|nr:right-handed parallel beta-helix repeat-containing protein [Methylomirabilota bacterium]
MSRCFSFSFLVGPRSLVLALVMSVFDGSPLRAETFYVATNGRDAWSGRSARPTRDGTDGPVATLAMALERARAFRAGNARESITILIREGTYELAEPVGLTEADSGLSESKPLLIAAYPKERPVLSGGRRITGWRRVAGRPGLWEADLPEAAAGTWRPRSLFVNGRRVVRARTPNVGQFFTMQGARLNDKPVRFRYRPGEFKPAWAGESGAEVVGFEKWTTFRQPIREVVATSNLMTLVGAAASHTREVNARYFIENVPDALDAAGEWWLDVKAGKIRYLAPDGEDLTRAEVVAPRLQALLEARGDASSRRAIRLVVLRGLTFRHTDWSLPADGYTDVQAAVRIRGDLHFEAAVGCRIEACTLEHLAGYGVDFGRACQGNAVVGCDLFDLGAGGVRIGESSPTPDAFAANHSHVVTDNHLRALGRVYPSAIGVLVLHSGTNRVAHNRIHDLFYTAISVGWNWGYQETACRANLIEFNHLHDVGQGLLSDMGGIYTLGIQKGTVVRNNLIHDIEAHTYGGWGLYADEGSTGIVWENNVVYRCKSAGFHQHYGRENVVRNNIFAFNREHQLMRTRDEGHISFYFTNNIVIFDSGTLLGSNWRNDRFHIDGNIYCDRRAPGVPPGLKMAGAAWSQWQARGHDAHSVFADPGFMDAARFDFRLKPDSLARARGFKPIDLSVVGVRERERSRLRR